MCENVFKCKNVLHKYNLCRECCYEPPQTKVVILQVIISGQRDSVFTWAPTTPSLSARTKPAVDIKSTNYCSDAAEEEKGGI